MDAEGRSLWEGMKLATDKVEETERPLSRATGS